MQALPEKAVKLLRLALDGAAHQGEWESAARMFVALLRKSGCTAETLTANPTKNRPPQPPPWSSSVMQMPFGKYKGALISEVPEDYLRWLVTCDLKPLLKSAVEKELIRRS